MEASRSCTLRARAVRRTALRLHLQSDRMPHRSITHLVHCLLSRDPATQSYGIRKIRHSCILLFDRGTTSTTRCSTINIKLLLRRLNIQTRHIKGNDLTTALSPHHQCTTSRRTHCRGALMGLLPKTPLSHKHHRCINSQAIRSRISLNINLHTKLHHKHNIRRTSLCMRTSSTSKSHKFRRQPRTRRIHRHWLNLVRTESCPTCQLILRP